MQYDVLREQQRIEISQIEIYWKHIQEMIENEKEEKHRLKWKYLKNKIQKENLCPKWWKNTQKMRVKQHRIMKVEI